MFQDGARPAGNTVRAVAEEVQYRRITATGERFTREYELSGAAAASGGRLRALHLRAPAPVGRETGSDGAVAGEGATGSVVRQDDGAGTGLHRELERAHGPRDSAENHPRGCAAEWQLKPKSNLRNGKAEDPP